MSQQKLKQYLYNTVIPEGYGMSMIELDEGQLDKLITLAKEVKGNLTKKGAKGQKLKALLSELTHLVEVSNSAWDTKYKICWQIKDRMFRVLSFDWYHPDCDYEDDVRAFYNAAKENIEEYLNEQ